MDRNGVEIYNEKNVFLVGLNPPPVHQTAR